MVFISHISTNKCKECKTIFKYDHYKGRFRQFCSKRCTNKYFYQKTTKKEGYYEKQALRSFIYRIKKKGLI